MHRLATSSKTAKTIMWFTREKTQLESRFNLQSLIRSCSSNFYTSNKNVLTCRAVQQAQYSVHSSRVIPEPESLCLTTMDASADLEGCLKLRMLFSLVNFSAFMTLHHQYLIHYDSHTEGEVDVIVTIFCFYKGVFHNIFEVLPSASGKITNSKDNTTT